jgi:ribonuclease Z
MHLQKRTNDLHLYSQPGLDEIITLQLKYSRSSLNYRLVFHPILENEPTCLFEDEKVSVFTIPLTHKVPCTGFLFTEKKKPQRINKEVLPKGILLQHIAQLKMGKDVFNPDGSILYKNEKYTLPPKTSYAYAYCSDTLYDEKIVSQIEGIDLLYHESTFMSAHQDKAAMTLHSTAQQAAQIAKQAKVKHLILGHFSARYKELDALLAEATKEFQNCTLAKEGETIDLADL